MKKNDNKLIKEVISTDLKKISNPDFTFITLQKIKESKKENRLRYAKRIDLTFIYPVFGFSFLLILFSIIKVFSSWFEIKQIYDILSVTQKISDLLFQPITISITIVFVLLYLFDSYLKKHSERFTKVNR